MVGIAQTGTPLKDRWRGGGGAETEVLLENRPICSFSRRGFKTSALKRIQKRSTSGIMSGSNGPYFKQIMLRVPQTLSDEISRAAAAERRSVANLTRMILEDWVAARPSPQRTNGSAHLEAAE